MESTLNKERNEGENQTSVHREPEDVSEIQWCVRGAVRTGEEGCITCVVRKWTCDHEPRNFMVLWTASSLELALSTLDSGPGI